MASTLVKIAVVGSGGVGKSALTIMYIQNVFISEYDPTIENSYRRAVQLHGENYILDILDTAGEEEYSVIKDQYYRAGEGFVFVYSVTCKSSLEDIEELIKRVNLAKDTENVPMVIVGNKCDLDDTRELTTEDGKSLATKYKCPFFESSAKCRINVPDIFEGAALQVEEKSVQVEKSVTPDNQVAKKKRKDCVIS